MQLGSAKTLINHQGPSSFYKDENFDKQPLSFENKNFLSTGTWSMGQTDCFDKSEGQITLDIDKNSFQDEMDFKRGKRQDIVRRNFLKALEEDEKVEMATKRVVTVSDAGSKVSSPLLANQFKNESPDILEENISGLRKYKFNTVETSKNLNVYRSELKHLINYPLDRKDFNFDQLAFKPSTQEDADFQRGKKQRATRRNFLKALEDEEEFEMITKKVKMSSDTETKASSPSLARKELEDEAGSNLSQKSYEEVRLQKSTNKLSVGDLFKKEDSQKSSNPSNGKANFKIDLKRCKSLNAFKVESRGKEIFFQVEYSGEVANSPKKVILTRKQMMESNAKIALYFYENHLFFAEDPTFQPEYMKRV